MPNTLAHIGINSLLARPYMRGAEMVWVYIGCVIPDLPWIVQRIVKLVYPSVDTYTLRLYVIAQASLFLCVILSMVIASLSNDVKKVFLALAAGSFLHLIVDMCQTKWANGVHLFAPFDWQMVNLGFFWPEDGLTYVLTVIGVLVFVVNWRTSTTAGPMLVFTVRRLSVALLFGFVYLLAPLLWLDDINASNSHFIKTIRSANKSGQYIEIDRAQVYVDAGKIYVDPPVGRQRYELLNLDLPDSNSVSIKGKFKSNSVLWVADYHLHASNWRDIFSIVGLLLVMLFILKLSISWLKNLKTTVG